MLRHVVIVFEVSIWRCGDAPQDLKKVPRSMLCMVITLAPWEGLELYVP